MKTAPKETYGSRILAMNNAMKGDTFADRVRDVVRHIPKGQTMTYKEVAAKAGSAGAARAVGMIMRNNYDPTVPCHRVIRSDGKMGGYNRGGIEVKEKMLRAEAKAAGMLKK
jgi:methylated-DNA-[protein]-cysteine S-methyltransferase